MCELIDKDKIKTDRKHFNFLFKEMTKLPVNAQKRIVYTIEKMIDYENNLIASNADE